MSDVHPSPEVSHRDLNEILNLHELDLSVFEDKRILDLGCGNSDLAGDLVLNGIRAAVYGVDVNRELFDAGDVSPLRVPVVANVDALPFASNSMDVVLATYSLPFWAISHEAVAAFFSEGERVTATGGIFSVYPMLVEHGTPGHGDLFVDARRRARAIGNSQNWKIIDKGNTTFTAIKLR